MRIDSYSKLQETNPVTAVGGGSKANQAPTQPSASPGETVTLSAAAREMADKAAAHAEAAKVATLSEAIQNGSFKVDAHAIAARIVEGG
jgi:negative regulator of flagellin synthesis FlgM